MKTTFTRMVCRCLLIAAVCCALPMAGWGQADVWEGNIANSFSGGDGNEATPYLISSGAELAYLAKGVNDGSITTSDKYFKLTNDIDLNDQAWTPIGESYNYSFQGNFDGDNHTISNLYISKETAHDYAGLLGFYLFRSNVTIKNLGITVGQLGITGKGHAGGLAGYIEGSYGPTLTIENCFVTGSLIDSDCKEGSLSCAGGMIGLITAPPYTINITNCYTCINTVTVRYDVNQQAAYAGGIVGSTGGIFYLTNCFAL